LLGLRVIVNLEKTRAHQDGRLNVTKYDDGAKHAPIKMGG